MINRTDLEDERQINHHGKVRTVKSGEEEDEIFYEKTPVERLFHVVSRNSKEDTLPEEDIPPVEGFDRDLIHKNERIQDRALKDYYRNAKAQTEQKRNILNACIMFSRRVKPVIAVVFVICYWSAGLWNYKKME